MKELFKLSGIFSSISLVLVIGVMMLQQDYTEDFETETLFIIKFGLTMNYAFWSILFITWMVMVIREAVRDIKNLKK